MNLNLLSFSPSCSCFYCLKIDNSITFLVSHLFSSSCPKGNHAAKHPNSNSGWDTCPQELPWGMNYKYVRSVGTLEKIPVILPHSCCNSCPWNHSIWLLLGCKMLHFFWPTYSGTFTLPHMRWRGAIQKWQYLLSPLKHINTHIHLSVCTHWDFASSFLDPICGCTATAPPHMLPVQNEMVIMEIRA